MRYKKIYLPLMACAMAACSKSDKEKANDTDPASLNSVSVVVEGEVTQSINQRGKDVSVGLLKFTKTSVEGFGVGGTVLNSAGKPVLSTSTGLMALQLNTGVEQSGVGGSVTVEDNAGKKDFSGMLYYLYYDTDPGQKNSKSYITLNTVQDTANLLKLSGEFHYNAAYAPTPESQDCVLDGVKNSGRIPAYNPDICGAKKVKVTGHFTIYLDKIIQQK
ncbi:hypothetical protein [Chitinophaga flava]|uniref:Lipoprotein n=1 Tax=Chitinophaga flava TaxID=2259036 RepID=A0A365XUK9_9BACT|nr:hypothetical protein [Chitinophaga flava]RBL90023.1 hypothetical protein DF182_26480 [Chitinophaga flava]